MCKAARMPISDDLLTTAEAAKLLRRPVGTVNRWAKDGELREAAKLPGRTGSRLYRRSDVEALAERKPAKDKQAVEVAA